MEENLRRYLCANAYRKICDDAKTKPVSSCGAMLRAIEERLVRMREIASMAASSFVTDEARGRWQTEADALKAEITLLATAQANGVEEIPSPEQVLRRLLELERTCARSAESGESPLLSKALSDCAEISVWFERVMGGAGDAK